MAASRLVGSEAARQPGGWRMVATACLAGTIVGGGIIALRDFERSLESPLPPVPDVAVRDLFVDDTPVPLTVTAFWLKVPRVETAERVSRDPDLWRQMHFDDWDAVASPLREKALGAMFDRYKAALGPPAIWDRMTSHEWDEIPQPIRALAFLRMMEYWSGYYRIGADFGLPRGTVTTTMSAIMMAESWFEHRGSYTNADGTTDLGLGGASEYCRETIRRLHRTGQLRFSLTDDQYEDPWRASRVLAVWFELMLREVAGDLDAAVRAYHRGSPAALRGEGHEYLDNIRRKRRQFMRNEASPPTWSYLQSAMRRWEDDRRVAELRTRRALQEGR